MTGCKCCSCLRGGPTAAPDVGSLATTVVAIAWKISGKPSPVFADVPKCKALIDFAYASDSPLETTCFLRRSCLLAAIAITIEGPTCTAALIGDHSSYSIAAEDMSGVLSAGTVHQGRKSVNHQSQCTYGCNENMLLKHALNAGCELLGILDDCIDIDQNIAISHILVLNALPQKARRFDPCAAICSLDVKM